MSIEGRDVFIGQWIVLLTTKEIYEIRSINYKDKYFLLIKISTRELVEAPFGSFTFAFKKLWLQRDMELEYDGIMLKVKDLTIENYEVIVTCLCIYDSKNIISNFGRNIGFELKKLKKAEIRE